MITMEQLGQLIAGDNFYNNNSIFKNIVGADKAAFDPETRENIYKFYALCDHVNKIDDLNMINSFLKHQIIKADDLLIFLQKYDLDIEDFNKITTAKDDFYNIAYKIVTYFENR